MMMSYERRLSDNELSYLMFEDVSNPVIQVVLQCNKVLNTKVLNDYLNKMPKIIDELTPILYTVPMQLLAFFVAEIRGTDIDKPRNLAKSVTVE